MIEFVTLFLGLVTGVQPVVLKASPEVATLEIRLDGQVVEVLREEPWTFQVDFGIALEPHELEVVARNETGRELGRLRQWINLKAPQADSPPLTAVLIRVDASAVLPPVDAMSSWFLKDGRSLEVERVEKGTPETGKPRVRR